MSNCDDNMFENKLRYTNHRRNLNYNYEITVNGGEPKLFTERCEIVEEYGISLSSIRHLIQNIRLGKLPTKRSKWEGYTIRNVCVPKYL